VNIAARDDFLGLYDNNQYQYEICSLWLRRYGCFETVVNALLLIARRKSFYATLNQLEQELSAEAATRSVHNRAAA
jgi:hypothetical protein